MTVKKHAAAAVRGETDAATEPVGDERHALSQDMALDRVERLTLTQNMVSIGGEHLAVIQGVVLARRNAFS